MELYSQPVGGRGNRRQIRQKADMSAPVSPIFDRAKISANVLRKFSPDSNGLTGQ
jgi:hypothetical protein